MTTEYLGVKQVAERLGVANAAVYDLPEPDVRIGRTRGWLPEPSTGGTRNVPAEASAAAGHASKTTNKEWSGSDSGPFLFMGASGGIRTRVHTQPQGRESNKDSRPVRSATDSYEGIRAGGFEHHRITEARDWLACHIGVCPL